MVGTLVLVEVERLPRGERRREPRVLWLWWHGLEKAAPDLELIWRSYVRRFDLEHTFRFLKQTLGWITPRVRHPEQADRWTTCGWWWWPPSHPAQAGAGGRCASAAALGTPLRHRSPDTSPGPPPRRFGAFGGTGHAREAADTLWEIARKTERPPLGSSQTLSGDQKERLSPLRQQTRSYCDELYMHRNNSSWLKRKLRW